MCMATPNALNWDDVRLFLAVLRAASLRAASQQLGLSRPTVARRLTGLEDQLGVVLFDRRPDGLHATAAGAALRPRAEAVEAAMQALTRAAQGADPELQGTVRVTVPPIVASELLAEDFVAFCSRWPQIDIEMTGSYDIVSLEHQRADVAIRFMPVGVAPDSALHGRKVSNAHIAIYGRGDCWIGQRGEVLDRSWAKNTPWPDLPIKGATLDGELQRRFCAAGMGMARLPCFFADGHLERRTEPAPGLDIWVLVHPDLRRNPRLRLFRDMVVDALKRQEARLQGRSPH
ncbi:MAG: DNA-binding transcriptional LysR family regulator [Myxococcota bacterium]|jgi:DNA-binding transcriptional LysR family regulator